MKGDANGSEAREAVPKVLNVTGLRKLHGGRAVIHDVNFSVLPGEIHCLLGRRGAGKSTIIKCVSGAAEPGAGRIIFGEDEIPYGDPAACLKLGIAAIYQDHDLVPGLTVAQSIFLGSEPRRAGLVNRPAMNRNALELLAEIGHGDIDPRRGIDELNPLQQRIVSIARALARGVTLLAIDESVKKLRADEYEVMFTVMRRLTLQGMGFIYASDRPVDMRKIGDRMTVLYEGAVIASDIPASTPVTDLIEMMDGNRIDRLYPPRPVASDEVVLEARGLGRGDLVRDVGFELRTGEVLGVGGVVGSGRTELMRLIYGLDAADTGEVLVDGKILPPMRPDRSIAAGVGLAAGAGQASRDLPEWTLTKNISLVDFTDFMHFALVESRSGGDDPEADAMIAEQGLGSLAGDPDSVLSRLSGSNRQKVALARWLLRHCRVLLLDEPTDSLDFRSKLRLYRVVAELAGLGMAVIFVSSNMRELAGFCTRILIMRNGEVVAEVPGTEANESELLRYATVAADLP